MIILSIKIELFFFVDIVFCRTWYKVDVPKFYCPVTTLLLPHDMKNAWQGVRTTGQLKREKHIKNDPSYDSLYKVSFIFNIYYYLILRENLQLFYIKYM